MKNRIMKATRELLCNLSSIGVVAPPTRFRENGISLMLRTKNEEWIDLSLLSVREFADEIVVVDSSTDDTPNTVQRVASEQGLNVKLIRFPDKTGSVLSDTQTYTEQSNIALKNTSFRWVFKWDGDLIARTSGEFDIAKLRERVLSLDEKKYHMVFLTYANLDGDLFHTLDRRASLSREAHLFTYSPRLTFKNMGRFEKLGLPLYYKPVFIDNIYIFHLRWVKSADRLLYRQFWTDWREVNDYKRFPTLQDYVAHRIQRDWNISDLNEAARINLAKLCQRLVPFSKEIYGDHPELLREPVENPRYKLLYKNGKIVGRSDIGFF